MNRARGMAPYITLPTMGRDNINIDWTALGFKRLKYKILNESLLVHSVLKIPLTRAIVYCLYLPIFQYNV